MDEIPYRLFEFYTFILNLRYKFELLPVTDLLSLW